MTPRVLIVDDDEPVRSQLERALGAMDLEVRSASDGREAWAAIRAEPQQYDLVVTDLRMPQMDGQELLQRLNQHHPEIPVAVITGHGDVDTTIAALRHGAFDFLTKPFGVADLQRLVRRFQSLRDDTTPLGILVESSAGKFFERLDIVIPSRRSQAQQIGRRLMHYMLPLLRAKRVSTNNFKLCLMEALENAIVHGNLQVESGLRDRDWAAFEATISERENDPQYVEREVRIAIDITAEMVDLRIHDQGEGFTPVLEEDPADAMATSGRGLFLIRSFMDEVDWEDGGSTIRLRKFLA